VPLLRLPFPRRCIIYRNDNDTFHLFNARYNLHNINFLFFTRPGQTEVEAETEADKRVEYFLVVVQGKNAINAGTLHYIHSHAMVVCLHIFFNCFTRKYTH